MIQDNLSREERIRLESIAQANVTHAPISSRRAADVVETAKIFEAYIRDGQEFHGSPGEVVSKAESIIANAGLTWETASVIVEALTTSGIVLGLKKPTK